jgi:hypothetical protein
VIEIMAERAGVDPAELRSWGPTERLLAKVIDAVQSGTFAAIQMNSKKKLTPPVPVDIPGSTVKPVPKLVSLSEARKLMGG